MFKIILSEANQNLKRYGLHCKDSRIIGFMRAADNEDLYKGHIGHVPDTTWIGKPDPHSWLDLDPKVNMSIGGQLWGGN